MSVSSATRATTRRPPRSTAWPSAGTRCWPSAGSIAKRSWRHVASCCRCMSRLRGLTTSSPLGRGSRSLVLVLEASAHRAPRAPRRRRAAVRHHLQGSGRQASEPGQLGHRPPLPVLLQKQLGSGPRRPRPQPWPLASARPRSRRPPPRPSTLTATRGAASARWPTAPPRPRPPPPAARREAAAQTTAPLTTSGALRCGATQRRRKAAAAAAAAEVAAGPSKGAARPLLAAPCGLRTPGPVASR
mmetsp:Transcript_132411/g.330197  ORF Transcript_132411/g.330197 Transcript_132411/m.330197 type:complete len:244 (-) Transcript_132411:191-922(-)